MSVNAHLPFGITWQGLVAGVILGAVFAQPLRGVTSKLPRAK